MVHQSSVVGGRNCQRMHWENGHRSQCSGGVGMPQNVINQFQTRAEPPDIPATSDDAMPGPLPSGVVAVTRGESELPPYEFVPFERAPYNEDDLPLPHTTMEDVDRDLCRPKSYKGTMRRWIDTSIDG